MKCNRCGKENPAEIHTCTPPLAIALADWIDQSDPMNGHIKAAAELRRLHAENEALRDALEKLARLGNGDQYGNSIGNEIARAALARAGEVK
jgi:hypothetical protein